MKNLLITLLALSSVSSFADDNMIACDIMNSISNELTTCILGNIPVVQQKDTTSNVVVYNCEYAESPSKTVHIQLANDFSQIDVSNNGIAQVIKPRAHRVAGMTYSGTPAVTLGSDFIVKCGALYHHGLKLLRDGL